MPHRRTIEDREFAAVVARVERRERAERRVGLVAALWLALSGLGLLAAGLAFLAIAPWGLLSGDPGATVVLGTLGSLLAGALALLALPGLLAGVGLRRRRPWARSLAVVLAVVALFWVPVGTLLGGVTLAVLLQDETGRLFAEA